jgi:hypothetical protein
VAVVKQLPSLPENRNLLRHLKIIALPAAAASAVCSSLCRRLFLLFRAFLLFPAGISILFPLFIPTISTILFGNPPGWPKEKRLTVNKSISIFLKLYQVNRVNKLVEWISNYHLLSYQLTSLVSNLPVDSLVSNFPVDSLVSNLPVDSLVSNLPVDSLVSNLPVDSLVSNLPVDG